MKKNIIKINNLGLILFAALTVLSCNGDSEKDASKQQEEQKVKFGSEENTILQVGKEVFSIPSPVQTAYLIQKTGASFDRSLTNSPKNAGNYSTRYKRALNLGIYGADLGYCTIYGQTQESLSYLASCKKLSDNLGIAGAFSPELIQKFEQNFGNQDEMLKLVSEAYLETDAFLKENENRETGVMIITGGWIEALYIATQVCKQVPPIAEVRKRVAEQKTTVYNLIKMIQPIAKDNEEIAALVSQLKELNKTFEGVKYTYTFEEPTTKPKEHLTIINSKSEVELSDEVLAEITAKVEEIRQNIIN